MSITRPGGIRRLHLLCIVVVAAAHLVAIAATAAPAHAATTSSWVNYYSDRWTPSVRYDVNGNVLDAHEGGIEIFNGTYYLYGESHVCAVMWDKTGTPWCGIRIYSSPDLVHWTDLGLAFDPTSADGIGSNTWQSDCNGSTDGCYRPHVVYNAANRTYVMWINGHGANTAKYWVLTSTSPAGPFTLANAAPTLAYANDFLGDQDIYVDADGTAYIVYTDWDMSGAEVIEQLNSSYTSGVGTASGNSAADKVIVLSQSNTEAPSMFKRNGLYYLIFSDPNCGYGYDICGASYRTSSSVFGTWSAKSVFSDVHGSIGQDMSGAACGGQPANVLPVPLNDGTTAYLFQIDRNMPTVYNQGPAGWYWAPLSFDGTGAIANFTCVNSVALTLPGSAGSDNTPAKLDQTSGTNGFRTDLCDLGPNAWRMQTFTASRNGTLSSVGITLYQRYTDKNNPTTTAPDQPLTIKIVTLDAASRPATVLSTMTASPSAISTVSPPLTQIGWAPRVFTVSPANVSVTAGTQYGILLSSTVTRGCYGYSSKDDGSYTRGVERMSQDQGSSWGTEPGRSLKFFTTVTGSVAASPNTINFGNVAVGTTSANQTITVTNNTSATVHFTGMSTSNPVFRYTGGTCAWNTVLSPGGSCTILLAARPTVTGPATGTRDITFSDAPAVSVPLSVTGV